MKGNVAAITLIAFGTFFLLSNLGLINVSLAEQPWPFELLADTDCGAATTSKGFPDSNNASPYGNHLGLLS